MSESNPTPASRAEKILAAMVAAIIGVSIIAFFAVIIGTFVGMSREDFLVGAWPLLTMMPLIGLPVGFVLILILLFVSTSRRRKGSGG